MLHCQLLPKVKGRGIPISLVYTKGCEHRVLRELDVGVDVCEIYANRGRHLPLLLCMATIWLSKAGFVGRAQAAKRLARQLSG